MDKPPTYIPRRSENGTWNVELTWASGKSETFGPFSSAADAEAEIKIRLEAWHDGLQKHGKRWNDPYAPRIKDLPRITP